MSTSGGKTLEQWKESRTQCLKKLNKCASQLKTAIAKKQRSIETDITNLESAWKDLEFDHKALVRHVEKFKLEKFLNSLSPS